MINSSDLMILQVTEWYEEKYVLQDFMAPLDKMLNLVNLCHKELAVYPLWLCPYKVMILIICHFTVLTLP